MLRQFWSWLIASPAPAYIQPWDAVRAERAAEATTRYLLGWSGPAVPSPTAAQRARKRGEAWEK